LGLGLALLRRPGPRLATAAAVGLALLPALAVYLLWRGYVARELAGGEVAVQTFAAWRWEALPRTLAHMAGVASQKIGFFGLALVLSGIGVRALWRPATATGRLALVFATLFLGYTAFLAFAYVAIFLPYEGERVASYWRYNTHLGLLAIAVAVAWLGVAWRGRVASDGRPMRVLRGAGVAAVVICLAAPIAFAQKLRFDIQPVKLYVRAIAPELKALLPPDARLAVLDPRGDGFYAIFLDYLLGSGSEVAVSFNAFTGGDAAAISKGLEAVGATHAWIHTQSAATKALFPGLPDNASHLIALTSDGWTLLRSWPFPGYSDPTAVPP
jgi:hypothetical protein